MTHTSVKDDGARRQRVRCRYLYLRARWEGHGRVRGGISAGYQTLTLIFAARVVVVECSTPSSSTKGGNLPNKIEIATSKE